MARSYDRWAIPQKEAVEELIQSCWGMGLPVGRILDAGCGTGLLSRYLMDLDCEGEIYGLDFSSEILECYKVMNPRWIEGNLEGTSLEAKSFEHSFSSFALHWTDLGRSIGELVRLSEKSITMGLPVDGSEVLGGMGIGGGFNFPRVGELMGLLEGMGVRIEKRIEKRLEIPYRGLDLVRYFHYTGTSLLRRRRSLKGKGFLEECEDRYQGDNYYRMIYMKCRV